MIRPARYLAASIAMALASACAAGDGAGPAEDPCVLAVPETADLGRVPSAVPARAAVAIENRGRGACALGAARLEGCGEEVALEVTGPFELAGGDTLPLALALAFEGNGSRSCELVLEREFGPERIAIRAEVDPTCFEIPAGFDVGPVVPACPRTRFLDLAQGCDVEVAVEAVTVADGPFAISSPELPFTLVPGDVLGLGIRFAPERVGPAEGTLHLRFAGAAEPRSVRLRGEGSDGGPEDVFHQAPRPKADLLFVIENGTSVAGALEHVAGQLRDFPSYVQAQEIDFHLGITTTGLEPGGDCPGGVGGGEDGRLVPVDGNRPRWFESDGSYWDPEWQGNLAVGACRTGPSMPLEAALRALSPPLSDHADDPRHAEPADGNAGFLRPDADLKVIVVTDRPDESPESPAFYVEALRSLKAGRAVDISAFTGDPDTGCFDAGISAGPGNRLEEAVEATDEGVFASFCEADWEMSLRGLASVAFGYPLCFYLSSRPIDADGNGVVDEADFEVAVDGEVLAPVSQWGQGIWEYRPDDIAICFSPLALPEPGAEIHVRYRPSCG